jgi:hypothetical protein
MGVSYNIWEALAVYTASIEEGREAGLRFAKSLMDLGDIPRELYICL